MRIVSWNVNGLRACAKKGFLQVLQRHKIDVMALQEVRAFPEQLPNNVLRPRGWHAHFAPAKRPGYSGVAIYSRVPPSRIESSLGESRFDDEGRFLLAQFGRLTVVSAYFPKGSGKDRDNSRVPYKMDFYRAVLSESSRSVKLGRYLCWVITTQRIIPSIWRGPSQMLRPVGFCPKSVKN